VLTLVPSSILLSTLGGQIAASQIAGSGTNGNVLQTVSGAATWVAPTALGLGATANPLVNGTVAIGTSNLLARQDHVHPIDTSRAPVASPTFTGTVTIPTGAAIADYAKLAAPTFTGLVTMPGGTISALGAWIITGSLAAPTPATTDNSTAVATTAFVNALLVTQNGGTY
jgi:hypothetical protein